MLPLCCKATGYPLQGSRRFQIQQSVGGGKKKREFYALLEACLQVHFLLCPLYLLQTLLQSLSLMGLGICVTDAHVMNTVGPILPEVTDKEVTLLFRVI